MTKYHLAKSHLKFQSLLLVINNNNKERRSFHEYNSIL
jgi:hypothetical protein